MRRPPDYSSNLCPPETFAIWLLGGVLGLLPVVSSDIKGPKQPLKKSYSKCRKRTLIRWAIWQWKAPGRHVMRSFLAVWVVILAAWERESICQKGQSCQEVVLKFFWASGAKVRKKSQALFCTGATLFRTSARDFFLTLAPEAQKNFSTTSWQLCPFWQIDSLSQAARITAFGSDFDRKIRIPIRPPTPTSEDDFPSDSGCGRSECLLRKPDFP